MIAIGSVQLEGYGVRLEPLELHHVPELAAAAADGALWELWYTSVPSPAETTSWQRTHVNTSCKLLLMMHAFEQLGCRVLGLRTDKFNLASQRASLIASEWPEVKLHLTQRLARYGVR